MNQHHQFICDNFIEGVKAFRDSTGELSVERQAKLGVGLIFLCRERILIKFRGLPTKLRRPKSC